MFLSVLEYLSKYKFSIYIQYSMYTVYRIEGSRVLLNILCTSYTYSLTLHKAIALHLSLEATGNYISQALYSTCSMTFEWNLL